MGGRTIKNPIDKIANIQLQTSAYGEGLPLQYGTNRMSGNLIWYGNFKAIPQTTKTKAGKGLGKVTSQNKTYTYEAAVMMALCEGPIDGIGTVWKGKDQSNLATLNLTLFAGNSGQAAWSFITSYSVSGNWANEALWGYSVAVVNPETQELTYETPAFVNQVLGYDTTAYLASSAYDLGDQAAIPNHGFEVRGKLIYSDTIPDANPKDIVADFLTSTQYGAGLVVGQLDDHTTFSQYCIAMGIFISPLVKERKSAAEYLQDWLDGCNTDALWSDGKLKLLPRADAAVTGNGETFTPNMTPVYDLDEHGFTPDLDGGPVRLLRKTPADAYNRIQIKFSNRANAYNEEPATAEDQDAIERYGLRPAPILSMPWITDAAIAKIIAQILLQRSLYQRNEYEFGLIGSYALLEPGDLVTLTDEAEGLDRELVRLLSIEEEGEGFSCTAESIPVGTANAALYTPDNSLRFMQNFNRPPLGDAAAPFIFELPSDVTSGLAVGIATGASPGDTLYGGCNVWVSLDDENYQQVGSINGSSRYGTLRSSVTSASTTFPVQMTSGGQLTSVGISDAQNGGTLIAIDEEYFSYQTSTLVGADQYDLTNLYRGLHETTLADHAFGANWARVDDAICVIDGLDLSMIGDRIYIKLTAFNAYEGGEQDLADVTAYEYVITGYMQILSRLSQPFFQSTPPGASESVPGQSWYDTDDGYRHYRRVTGSGFLVDENGDFIYLCDNPIEAAWTLAADQSLYEAILASTQAIDRLDDLDDDGIITIVEKNSVLIPDSAVLETQWQDLDARAAVEGITTERTAAANARTAWLALRNSLTPSWNDISQNTPVTRIDYDLVLHDYRDSLSVLAIEVSRAQAGGVGPQGPPGPSGLNNATIYLYKRSATPPAVPSTLSTYTFATALLTGHDNGWTQTVPVPDGNPLYITAATASSSATTDTIATGEWATPVIHVQDGVAGINSATVYIFQRAATVPAVPSVNLTYTFATALLSGGSLGSWTQTVPAHDGNPLWVTTATALSTSATDIIPTTEWASAQVMAEDGATGPTGPDGPTGPAGLNTARVFIYQRAASAPTLPSATTTYTFATAGLTGLDNGWGTAVPTADGNPLYAAVASAAATTATDTIGSGEWAGPLIFSQDGSAGTKTATIYLFKRAASVPAVPSTTSTYTFATAILTGHDNGWTQGVPTTDGNPLWITIATALGTGATDSIPTGEWAVSTVMAEDGATGPTGPTGGTGNKQVMVFQRASSLPATPTGNGTPSGWSLSIPADDGNPVYMSGSEQTSADVLVGTWRTPILYQAVAPSGASGHTNILTSQSATSTAHTRGLDNGASLDIYATIRVEDLLGNMTQNIKIAYREGGSGGGYTDLGAQGSDSGSVGDDVVAEAIETLTNSSGFPKVYEIVAITSKTGSTGTVIPASSFIRI